MLEANIITSDNELNLGIDNSASQLNLGISSSQVGITNYENLSNLPQINSVTLKGNKKLEELNIQEKIENLSNTDIENLLNNQN